MEIFDETFFFFSFFENFFETIFVLLFFLCFKNSPFLSLSLSLSSCWIKKEHLKEEEEEEEDEEEERKEAIINAIRPRCVVTESVQNGGGAKRSRLGGDQSVDVREKRGNYAG